MPAGAFRGYGLSQSAFAVESALDELARKLDIDPAEFRRRNVIRPGDPMTSLSDEPDDVQIGSYGLAECLDLVQAALASGRGEPAPAGPGWRSGTGIAVAMLDSVPPGGHHAHATDRAAGRRRLHPVGGDRGVRQRHRHGAPPAGRRRPRGRAGRDRASAVRHRPGPA